MDPRCPTKATIFTAALLAIAGFVLGVFTYAQIGADSNHIPEQVQNGLVLSIGAVLAGLVAGAGTYWGSVIASTVAAGEGEATRKEARRLSLLDAKREIVRLISVRSNRHARQVLSQVERRQELAGKPYEPLPEVSETTAIEDAIGELYSLGFQSTGDHAQALLNALFALDRFCYVATPESTKQPITGLSDEEHFSAKVWFEVQRIVKTDMIQAGLQDEGVDRLKDGGTLPEGYLRGLYIARYQASKPAATIVSTVKPAMADTAAAAHIRQDKTTQS